MKRTLTLLILCLGIITIAASGQTVYEWGIKPSELFYRNLEVNFGLGNKLHRYGIFLAYRPSTQNSGLVKEGGSGMAGGYGLWRVMNKLYDSYTAGVYYKMYIKKHPRDFFEVDAFYRNWNFKNKYAEFQNVEGYRFKGLRTENVDVYALKLLAGETVILTRKNRKLKPYMDVYAGVGIREQKEVYETFNGTVYDTYYGYKKDEFNHLLPSVHFGIRLGLLKGR